MVGRATRVAGLALLLLATSCTSGSVSPSPSASGRPTGATHLQLIEAEDAQTLDPARLDANQRPVPGLAERWEIADAGRTYTFHLRNAHYQSGATVQAQDALSAWTRALAPQMNSPLTIFFSPLGARYPGDSLTGVQAVDSTTLRVQLPQANSELLTLLALPPYWLIDPKQPTAGAGPYHLDKWERGRALQLSAYTGYWGSSPSVRKVDIEIEPDNTKRLDRFTSGGADIAHGFGGSQLLAFARDPQRAAELHRVPNTRATWLLAKAGYDVLLLEQGPHFAKEHRNPAKDFDPGFRDGIGRLTASGRCSPYRRPICCRRGCPAISPGSCRATIPRRQRRRWMRRPSRRGSISISRPMPLSVGSPPIFKIKSAPPPVAPWSSIPREISSIKRRSTSCPSSSIPGARIFRTHPTSSRT